MILEENRKVSERAQGIQYLEHIEESGLPLFQNGGGEVGEMPEKQVSTIYLQT
jgi:hypothetical protein